MTHHERLPHIGERNSEKEVRYEDTVFVGVDAVFVQFAEESEVMDSTTAPSYTVTYDTSLLSIGENLFSILAIDTAGQESSSESSFTVNNVTSTTIENLMLSPYVISTASLADSVRVTLTAADSFYDLSLLEGSCSLESIDVGALSYKSSSKTHELSFIPEIGLTTTDLGERQ